MKNVSWFVLGVVGGFVAAHFVNKNPAGHDVLAEFDARIGEFTDRIGEAYRSQESRFDAFVDEARDAAARVSEAVADATSSKSAD
ncbi:ATPase [Microbacterium sp. LRZ72]|uniref:ATPase n=1 Tax=Microbacterium sp. LRZ72 TaxID=2942481 RepID=UPI0029ADAA92|nr:ATPase [Microbacterium sp. LRZ72]MDX2375374.1 ATPase [Microbacterium sp. LRZ72]